MGEREMISVKPQAMPCPTCGYLLDAQRLDEETVTCPECGDEHESQVVRQYYVSGGRATSPLYDSNAGPAVAAQFLLIMVVLCMATLLPFMPLFSPVAGLAFGSFAIVSGIHWFRSLREHASPIRFGLAAGVHFVYFLSLAGITAAVLLVAVMVSVVMGGSLATAASSFKLLVIGGTFAVGAILLLFASARLERALISYCRRIEEADSVRPRGSKPEDRTYDAS